MLSLTVKTSFKITPITTATRAPGISFSFFRADGTTRVLNVDTANSRIGIGTTTPGYKLDVFNGDINAGGTGKFRLGGTDINTSGALSNVVYDGNSITRLVEDSTHRTVTDTEKTTWNNKLDGISLSTQTIDFLDEQNQVELIVVDSTVTANTIINVRHASEDLALQGVTFYVVKNIGAGYSIFGVAPNGASGQYQIQIEKVEGE